MPLFEDLKLKREGEREAERGSSRIYTRSSLRLALAINKGAARSGECHVTIRTVTETVMYAKFSLVIAWRCRTEPPHGGLPLNS
jgi:hypothetical protein